MEFSQFLRVQMTMFCHFIVVLLEVLLFTIPALAVDGIAPDESHFRKVVLATNLNEPIQLSVAKDGRVYFGERHGAVKVWNPKTEHATSIGHLNVFTGPEDGLLGLALDPGFVTNHWVYIFHSTVGILENRVSRFTVNGDALDLDSQK